jgi:hypothetical protein
MLMEEFYKSLRSDFGIASLGLKDGDLAQLLLLRHGDLHVAMAWKGSDLPLSGLGAMEKANRINEGFN